MSFDDIPEDEIQTFLCPHCPGDVTLNRQGIWECDSCDFAKAPTSEKGERDCISEKIAELDMKLYGPRYCQSCDKVQPVETFVLQGSEKSEMKGTTYVRSFTGSHVCRACHHTIKEGFHD